MKQKKRFIFPLMLLFIVMIAGSAFAAPKLSKKTVILQRYTSVGMSPSGSNSVANSLYTEPGTAATQTPVYVDGISKDAVLLTKKVKVGGKNFSLYLKYSDYYDKFYLEYGWHGGKVYSIWKDNRYLSLWFTDYLKAGKYKVKVRIKDRGTIYTFPLTFKIENKIKNSITSLQIGNRTYKKEFQGDNVTIVRINTTVNKRVKVKFNTTPAYKSYNKIVVITPPKNAKQRTTIKIYRNGAKIKLKPRDIICLAKSKYDEWSPDEETLIPVTINFNFLKYRNKHYLD